MGISNVLKRILAGFAVRSFVLGKYQLVELHSSCQLSEVYTPEQSVLATTFEQGMSGCWVRYWI